MHKVDRQAECREGQRLGEKYYVIEKDQVLSLNRGIDISKEELVSIAKREAMDKILAVAPYYKQINAALGLLSEEDKKTIIDHIQLCREECLKKESAILGFAV